MGADLEARCRSYVEYAGEDTGGLELQTEVPLVGALFEALQRRTADTLHLQAASA